MDKYQTTGTSSEPKQTELNMVLLRLSATVDETYNKFSDLAQRIEPVTRQDVEVLGQEKAVNPEYQTKVAQEINNNVRRLRELSGFIDSVKSRIEI